MKYTKDDLAKMGDFEINKAIVALCKGEYDGSCGSSAYFIHQITGHSKSFNFTDWNDLMPLAVEHKLNILSPDIFSKESEDGWNCFNDGGSCESYSESPQRAIACCLILVLQERE